MQECRFYAGASFESSPDASKVPLPPLNWIEKSKKRQIGKDDVKPSLPAKTVIRKGKFLTSG